ncbi:histidine--tRNA ligase [Candidatus Parcubacteria bacterium]|nr:histidine--tRNA ligase [Candidatus Parcubacteria bacterium]
MKKTKLQRPTGMHDVLGEEQEYFQKIHDAVKEVVNFYHFKKIITPILEETELFVKGTGAFTDIVEKEMFSLHTKGGDHLSLRPEGTPGVVRSYIEHGMKNLPQPVKFWYFGPFFRYERPQAGRYRQFHQAGLEVIGEKNAVVDVQVIQIFYSILKKLKFKNLLIEINSLGDSQCRPNYRRLLVRYLKSRENLLCPDCKRRLKENPLRILDCKEEKCQEVVSDAPQMVDHLCDECKLHFKEVLEFLDEVGIPYYLNPYLVRGLDYYTRTVFEIIEEGENRSQGTLIAGGRYDNLIKLLGGKDTPACGGAMGVERVINALKNKKISLFQPSVPEIYLAQLGVLAKRKSLKLLENFRTAKIPVSESFSKDSLGVQLGIASKMGVKYALIFGQKEALEDSIIIRNMKTSRQDTVKIANVIKEIRKRLKK